MQETLPRLRMRVLRRLRAGLPDRDPEREDRSSRSAQPEHSVVTTCAYCGVGCTLQGRDARRRSGAHGALQGRQGQPRPFLRQGPLRLGLCHPQGPHPQADDPRQDHRPVARGELGRGDRATPPPSSSASRRNTAATRSAASPPRAAPTRKPSWCRSWSAPASATTTSTPAPASAIRRPATASRPTFGTSAGTQDFDSVEQADVIMVIGANPTDGHPVFASRMKRRLRAGRQADRRRSAPHRPGALAACRGRPSPAAAARHQRRRDQRAGPCHRHRRAGRTRPSCASAATATSSQTGRSSSRWPQNSPGGGGEDHRRAGADDPRARRGSTPPAAMRAIYYGLGVTEHSQGSTTVMGIANLAMATGNIGRDGVGVNPLRGQNNVQGSCDMGSFPHELSGYRHVSDDAVRELFEAAWGVHARQRAGPAHSQHVRRRGRRQLQGHLHPGRGHRCSPTRTPSTSPPAWRRWNAWSCRTCSSTRPRTTPTCSCPARPSWRRTAPSPTPSGASSRVRKVMAPQARLCRLGGHACCWPTRWATRCTTTTRREIMDEIARLTPTFAGVSLRQARRAGLDPVAVQRRGAGRHADHACRRLRARQGQVHDHRISCRPTRRTGPRFPLLLTTGRILVQYNVGAQTRRTANVVWHEEDVLEIHPHDAEQRGISDGDWVALASRAGETALRAHDHRARGAGRRLHDLPPSRHAGQRRHHRVFRLGDQLPGIQGDGGAGLAVERAVANGRRIMRSFARESRRIAPVEAAE